MGWLTIDGGRAVQSPIMYGNSIDSPQELSRSMFELFPIRSNSFAALGRLRLPGPMCSLRKIKSYDGPAISALALSRPEFPMTFYDISCDLVRHVFVPACTAGRT